MYFSSHDILCPPIILFFFQFLAPHETACLSFSNAEMFVYEYKVDLHIVRVGYVLYCIIVFPDSVSRIWSFVQCAWTCKKLGHLVTASGKGVSEGCGRGKLPLSAGSLRGSGCRIWKFMKKNTQTLIWGRRLLSRKFLLFFSVWKWQSALYSNNLQEDIYQIECGSPVGQLLETFPQ